MSADVLDEPIDDSLSNTMWPLDVALGALGTISLFVVVQNFSFNHSDWLYNGWTYVAAILFGVVGLDIVLRKIASRFVQRSMQLGFLVSILVHIALLMMALNMVLFERMWPVPQAGKQPVPRPIHKSVPEHFFNKSVASNESKEDWAKPVETKSESRTTPEPSKQEIEQQNEPPTLENRQQLKVELKVPASEMAPRRQVDTKLPTQEAKLEMQRQASSAPQSKPQSQQAAVPEVAAQQAASQQIEAKPLEVSPSRANPTSEPLAATSLQQAPAHSPQAPTQTAVAPAATPLSQPRVAMSQRQLSRNQPNPNHSNAPPSSQVAQIPSLQAPSGSTSEQPAPAMRSSPTGRMAMASGAQVPLASGGAIPSPTMASGGSTAAYNPAAAGRDAPNIPAMTSSGSPIARRNTQTGMSGSPPAGQVAIDVPGLAASGEKTGEESPANGGTVGERSLAVGRIGERGEARDAPSLSGPREAGPSSITGGQGLSDRIASRAGPGRNGDIPNPIASSSMRQSLQRRSLENADKGILAAPKAAVPFLRRMSRMGGGGAPSEPGMAGPETEEAIENGLRFIASLQNTDGSWSLQAVDPTAVLRSDTAATGLCLLAFQGAGYTHRQHQYAGKVDRGIDWLIAHQQEDGNLYKNEDESSDRNVWLYSHGVAALALCEAYGMTQDPKLKEPAQKAIDFILKAQHPTRGAWRYQPQVSSDTSVSGWMVMSLKSGELAGLKVSPEGYRGVRTWLDLSRYSGVHPYLFRYNPYAPDTPSQRHGRDVTPSMTGVGLLMEMYLGWRRDNPNLERGADWLLKNPPSNGTSESPQRDSYYWYYATQVMFHMGGERWKQWNDKLNPLLIQSQVKNGELSGSWDPQKPVPDRWGVHAGRLYVTTMNLLNLEIYYRHLPIYEDTAQ